MASPGQIWIALCLLVLSMLHRKLRARWQRLTVWADSRIRKWWWWNRHVNSSCYSSSCYFSSSSSPADDDAASVSATVLSSSVWTHDFNQLTPSPPICCYLLHLLPCCLHYIYLGLQISSPSAFMSLYISFLEWGPVNGFSSNTSDRFLNARFPQR